jgi:hypothetical protein
MNMPGQACATYSLKTVFLSSNTLTAFLKNELSHIHRQSSFNVAPNNLVFIMFTNLNS